MGGRKRKLLTPLAKEPKRNERQQKIQDSQMLSKFAMTKLNLRNPGALIKPYECRERLRLSPEDE